MSGNPWSQYFTAASFTPGPWGTGSFSDGDIAPEDIVLHLAKFILCSNAKLTSVFGGPAESGGRIEVMDARNPIDRRPMPRLQLYLGAAPESREVTKSNEIRVNLNIGIRYLITELAPIAYGQGSIASLVRHIKKALRATRNDTLVVARALDSIEVSLASKSEAGPIDYLADYDEETGRVVGTRQLSWIYHIKLNESTDRIWNLGA